MTDQSPHLDPHLLHPAHVGHNFLNPVKGTCLLAPHATISM